MTELVPDRLLIMPDCLAPHKAMAENTPSPEHRLEMCRLAFGDIPGTEISELEIRRGGSEGPVLLLGGADLLDGTPVYDVKPYVVYADSVPGASGGFTGGEEPKRVPVTCPEEVRSSLPAETWEALAGVLACDPRPGYHDDPHRVYGFSFAGREVRFTADAEGVHVVGVSDGTQKEG